MNILHYLFFQLAFFPYITTVSLERLFYPKGYQFPSANRLSMENIEAYFMCFQYFGHESIEFSDDLVNIYLSEKSIIGLESKEISNPIVNSESKSMVEIDDDDDKIEQDLARFCFEDSDNSMQIHYSSQTFKKEYQK